MDYAHARLTLADTADWSALVTVLAEADDTGELYSPEDLAEELADPALAAEDTVAYRSVDGELVAFGQLWHRSALVEGASLSFVAGGVHPAHRGRGLGSAIYEELENRAVEVASDRHADAPVMVRSDAGVQVEAHRRLLGRRGYREARFFHEMRLDLPGPPPHAGHRPVPDIRPYRPEDDEAVRLAHESAFAQHWKSAPMTVEEWRSRVTGSRTFRPALSFVRPGPDGRIDGYILGYGYQDHELWIGQLGVRDHARDRGVGSALLAAAVQAAAAAGYTEVGLGVDTDNVTGAGRLYEAAGFRVVRTTVAHLKTLTPPAG